jgi:hypothetical protein
MNHSLHTLVDVSATLKVSIEAASFLCKSLYS